MTRTAVQDPTAEQPGTITVDTKNRYLYLSMPNGEAMRYEIGVGRDGFTWSGNAYIARRAEWPAWTPPPEMIKRRPDIPHFMKGGNRQPARRARHVSLQRQGRLPASASTAPTSPTRSVRRCRPVASG